MPRYSARSAGRGNEGGPSTGTAAGCGGPGAGGSDGRSWDTAQATPNRPIVPWTMPYQVTISRATAAGSAGVGAPPPATLLDGPAICPSRATTKEIGENA